MIGAVSLLEFVAAERLKELILARRNTTSLLKRGAREVAPSHYPLIVAFTPHRLADCVAVTKDPITTAAGDDKKITPK